MAWLWSGLKPAPKRNLKLGEDCKPGRADEGTVEHYVESLIQKRLQDEPDQISLRAMENYVKGLDIIRKSGQDPCQYWISDCIQFYKRQTPPSIGARFIASRISHSDAGSSSSSSNGASQPSSSGSDNGISADEMIDVIPFEITTRTHPPRQRVVMVRPTRGRSENCISRRVAEDCGFTEGSDSRIDVDLKLGQESRRCSLLVREIESDLIISDKIVVSFRSYQPGDRMYDHFNQSSTGYQTSNLTTLKRHNSSSHAGSSRRDRDEDLALLRRIAWRVLQDT